MEHTKTALVTGASSGIGRALANQLRQQGWNLILLGRKAAPLTDLAGEVFEADLADRGSTKKALLAIGRKYPQIDAVFANAGVLLPSMVFSDQGREMHFEVHVVATHQILTLLRPALVAGRATVVASGSSARHLARTPTVESLMKPLQFIPMAGPYAASKQALATVFGDTAAEWAAQGVSLRYVDLPPTRTAMSEGPGFPGWMRWARGLFSTPEASARKLIQALDQPRPLRFQPIPGLVEWLKAANGA